MDGRSSADGLGLVDGWTVEREAARHRPEPKPLAAPTTENSPTGRFRFFSFTFLSVWGEDKRSRLVSNEKPEDERMKKIPVKAKKLPSRIDEH